MGMFLSHLAHNSPDSQWGFQDPEMEVPTIFKAYVYCLSNIIYPPNMALYDTVPPFLDPGIPIEVAQGSWFGKATAIVSLVIQAMNRLLALAFATERMDQWTHGIGVLLEGHIQANDGCMIYDIYIYIWMVKFVWNPDCCMQTPSVWKTFKSMCSTKKSCLCIGKHSPGSIFWTHSCPMFTWLVSNTLQSIWCLDG